jgi:hypothetical protein
MTSDEQAIRDLVARWHSATAAGDVDTVLSLMAEDVIFLGVGRPPIRGRSAFESGLRKLLAEHRIESTGRCRRSKSREAWRTAGRISRSGSCHVPEATRPLVPEVRYPFFESNPVVPGW